MIRHQRYALIQHYRLNDWLEATDTGFRTRQFADAGIRWKTTGLAALLIIAMVLKFGSLDLHIGWLLGCLALFGLLALGRHYWRIEFDLVERKVSAGFGKMGVFKRDLSQFTGFGWDKGYIVNGVDAGGSLYMNFNGASKLRIAVLRDPEDFRNLQTVLIEAMVQTNTINLTNGSSEVD